ncbi:hypothetical protein STENM223S_05017 [Streptomyces tendae]
MPSGTRRSRARRFGAARTATTEVAGAPPRPSGTAGRRAAERFLHSAGGRVRSHPSPASTARGGPGVPTRLRERPVRAPSHGGPEPPVPGPGPGRHRRGSTHPGTGRRPRLGRHQPLGGTVLPGQRPVTVQEATPRPRLERTRGAASPLRAAAPEGAASRPCGKPPPRTCLPSSPRGRHSSHRTPRTNRRCPDLRPRPRTPAPVEAVTTAVLTPRGRPPGCRAAAAAGPRRAPGPTPRRARPARRRRRATRPLVCHSGAGRR